MNRLSSTSTRGASPRLLSTLRRLQGEIMVLKKQMDLYARAASEFTAKQQLLVALRDGLFIDPSINLLEVEGHYVTLWQRTEDLYHKINTTRMMIQKLFKEMEGDRAILEMGMEVYFTKDFHPALQNHERLLDEAQKAVQEENLTRLEELVEDISNHRYIPPLYLLSDAFGITTNGDCR